MRAGPSHTILALTLVAGSFALAVVTPADAGFRRAPEGDVAVAVSRHGNGSVSGPVRQVRNGYEVRTPGGNWIACRKSCSETLRVQTVDIFENEGSMSGYGTQQNECGIFGCLDFSIR